MTLLALLDVIKRPDGEIYQTRRADVSCFATQKCVRNQSSMFYAKLDLHAGSF